MVVVVVVAPGGTGTPILLVDFSSALPHLMSVVASLLAPFPTLSALHTILEADP